MIEHMTQRGSLPIPATMAELYLFDIAQSLREIVKLLTPDPAPAPTPPAPDTVELREPGEEATREIPKSKRKPTRDMMQARDLEG